MGNLDSCFRALIEAGGSPLIVSHASDYQPSEPTILPGVGAFGEAMERLDSGGWTERLQVAAMDLGTPFLGVCLGMQLLAETGEEGGATNGLGWIGGQVKRLAPTELEERIPHVGWNEVEFRAADCPLFAGISDRTDFYFTHSHHFMVANPDEVLGDTPYCSGIASVIGRDNLFGTQFHPEKSQRPGLLLYKNFLSL
jgi:glutamine amidotransferase